MKPCCARPNIPLHPRHGRGERISQMREAGRALRPVKPLVFAAMRCRDGLATLSALKSRSLSIRHKGALGVRRLLRDASIYRPSNRREAEREAANRFAGIRPPCCPTLCVPPLRALPCQAEPRAPVAAARPNTFWSKLHCPSICPRRAARSRAAPQRIRV